jgi:hypothetical protein
VPPVLVGPLLVLVAVLVARAWPLADDDEDDEPDDPPILVPA